MYGALIEDQMTFQIVNPNIQAYYFITLNYEKVSMIIAKESAEFVEKNINYYNKSRGGSLKLDNLRKVLERQDFLPSFQHKIAETFTIDFTFAIIRLKKIMEIDRELMKNHFGCRILTGMIFDLCLIVENIFKKSKKLKGETLNRLLEDLSLKYKLSLNRHNFYNFRLEYNKDFSGAIQKLLDSRYTFADIQRQKINMIHIEEDMAIVFALRNFRKSVHYLFKVSRNM